MKHSSKFPVHGSEVPAPGTGPEPAKADDTIDPRVLFNKLWMGKWTIFACTVACATLGLTALTFQTERYRASARVLVDTPDTNVVNIQEVLVDQQFDRDTVLNEIEILRSTGLIERVIHELRLEYDEEFNPFLQDRKAPLLERVVESLPFEPTLRPIFESAKLIKPEQPPLTEAATAEMTRVGIISAIRKNLEITPVGESRVLAIAFTSTSPRTAARVVNEVANQYIVDQLEAQLNSTRSATEWLSEQSTELRIRMEESEAEVEELRAEIAEQEGQSREVTQQRLDGLVASLARARQNATVIAATQARLQNALEDGTDLNSISEFRNSVLIQRYRTEIDDLTAELQKLSRYHPERRSIEANIDDLDERSRREAIQIVEAIDRDLQVALDQEKITEAEIIELENRLVEQSGSELKLHQLEREALANRSIYENFIARLKETSVQEDLQKANARVLTPAEVPAHALTSTRNRIAAASILGGLILGTCIVLLRDALNTTFRATRQIEEMTGLPVLANIPSIGKKAKRGDIVRHLMDNPGSALSEAIRNLRTSILLSNVDRPPRVIMFTSSVPREGKSTTSILTALTSRKMGRSAIIVDCDLHLPTLSGMIGAGSEKPGLLSILESTSTVEDAIHEDQETGLHIIMSRTGEKRNKVNAADILSSKKFENLISELTTKYEMVVLDTPPALVVSDARILSANVDAVIYTLRWDDTPRGAVMDGLRELQSIDAPIAGLVVTMINESKAARYAYEGHRYYKGQYRDYYVEQ
ncbi:GumC family protein [Amaricoccus tamworthensis]|uniref:GumC family protein n=1 Tax=Amaricoccus tamworthensis TaxID=57002 RepID=UPI003C7DF6C6